MRILLVMTVLLFAGCAAPEESNDALFGYCPNWVSGNGSVTDSYMGEDSLLTPWSTGDNGSVVGFTYEGRDLDAYLIEFTQITGNGSIEVRAFHHEDDRRLLMRDLRADRAIQPVVTLTRDDVGAEFEVLLADLDGETNPGRLRLEWRATGTIDVAYEALFLYRVCGM